MRQALAFISLLALATSAGAQTVSSDGAKQLADTFAKYVGATALTKGIVKVAVDGDAYKLEVDFDALAGAIPKQDVVKFDLEPYALRVKPRPDGRWDVAGDLFPNGWFEVAVTGAEPAERFDWNITDGRLAGIYDPELAAFSSAEASHGLFEMKSGNGTDQTNSRYGKSTSTMTAAKSVQTGIDFTAHQIVDGVREAMTFDAPEAGMNFSIVFDAQRYIIHSNVLDLQSKPMLDLLAFGVANTDAETLKRNQATLKTSLLAALPFWERLEGHYGVEKVSVQTPLGIIEAESLGVGITAGGVSQNGSLNYDFRAEGLKVPSQAVPAWAVPLLPTDFTLNFGGTEIDLDRPARRAIEAFDLNQPSPISEEVAAEIGNMFIVDPPKFVIEPSFVRNKDTEITYQGEMTFAGGVPAFRATVEASGYDEIVEALQAAAATDTQAQQAFPAALAAKAYAKVQPDGGLRWEIEMKPDRSLLVNGGLVMPAAPETTPPAE